MSHEIVPFENVPDDPYQHASQSEDRAGDKAQANGRRRRRPRKSKIFSRDDCLRFLSQLPGLITAEFLTPAEANAIHRVVETLLAESRTPQSTGSPQVLGKKIICIVRANPELLELLEPLLTDEQIESLMKDVMDDNQPET
jgi:hypothetical protein